jgi:hypothetical protein
VFFSSISLIDLLSPSSLHLLAITFYLSFFLFPITRYFRHSFSHPSTDDHFTSPKPIPHFATGKREITPTEFESGNEIAGSGSLEHQQHFVVPSSLPADSR